MTAGNYFYNGLETIEPNDNRRPSGQLKDGVLTIALEAQEGVWYPETAANPGIPVFAFAEEGKPLQLPGPLIRVSQGTEISLSIKNSIGKTLDLIGFHERSGKPADIIKLLAGEVWKTKFKPGSEGTYHYRANTEGPKRFGWPRAIDNQLYGTFIVDGTNEKPNPAERILMIGMGGGTLSTKDD